MPGLASLDARLRRTPRAGVEAHVSLRGKTRLRQQGMQRHRPPPPGSLPPGPPLSGTPCNRNPQGERTLWSRCGCACGACAPSRGQAAHHGPRFGLSRHTRVCALETACRCGFASFAPNPRRGLFAAAFTASGSLTAQAAAIARSTRAPTSASPRGRVFRNQPAAAGKFF